MLRVIGRAALSVLALCSIVASANAQQALDPKLSIEGAGREVILTRSALIARADVETIHVDDESAYARQKMSYRAVKMAALLAPLAIADDATLEFIATDGFSSPIPYSQLRNSAANASIAYLAIEDPANKWPKVRTDPTSGGPFYLVWMNPRLSGIGREEWPYRVTRIAVKDSIDKLYPGTQPGAKATSAVMAGHRVYAKNCLACHSLNEAGPAQIAPDLNAPLSPTEYFRPGILRQFIRNPQSVRKNPRSPMGPFPATLISNAELDQLIAYLEHMARKRRESPAAAAKPAAGSAQ